MRNAVKESATFLSVEYFQKNRKIRINVYCARMIEFDSLEKQSPGGIP